ncbi:hypothetical protein K458DRAFT_389768 [Lentithecium fluviatile CBS 122367]|uniref:2,6-dihydroxypyridine 3-monooxygenase substrate binding domain-containing protein n=1 Tax=Lentithecium fluviatile CBS 122367 TaxID=1168545 RepID=A0A6G1J014_9PLEO|nr:hypothetical protein K458DRAFT_389768 [Lentithecium fluviatile CBS 122367]
MFLTIPPKTIAIIGGSLTGLLAGVALKCLRKDLSIRIFERNPTPLLHGQGAGVVAGQDVLKFFQGYDRTRTPLAVPSHQRLYLDGKGGVMQREDSVQQMTSWDLLYHLWRANLDGVGSEYAEAPEEKQKEDGDGTKTAYEYGCTVTDVIVPTTSSSTSLNFSKPVELKIKRESGGSLFTTVDLGIAADGPSSAIRSLYYPGIQCEYAGYVAWRGTVTETLISESAVDTFVWYCNYPASSPQHTERMADKDGKRHHITLPPGGIQSHVWKQQKSYAAKTLPPHCKAPTYSHSAASSLSPKSLLRPRVLSTSDRQVEQLSSYGTDSICLPPHQHEFSRHITFSYITNTLHLIHTIPTIIDMSYSKPQRPATPDYYYNLYVDDNASRRDIKISYN